MGFLARLAGRQTASPKKAANDCNYESSKYRGVQVTASTDACCEAAKAISGKRFLSDNVPMLPLDDCDANNCQCTYKLYDDRRTDCRRASDLGSDIATQLSENSHRNSELAGRRIDD